MQNEGRMNAATRAKRLISAAAEGMKGFTPGPSIYVVSTMARDRSKLQFSLIGNFQAICLHPFSKSQFQRLNSISCLHSAFIQPSSCAALLLRAAFMRRRFAFIPSSPLRRFTRRPPKPCARQTGSSFPSTPTRQECCRLRYAASRLPEPPRIAAARSH
jgi:hypothetical protein